MDARQSDASEDWVTAADLIAAGVDPGAVARLPVREVGPRGPRWRFRIVTDWLDFVVALACEP